MLYCNDEKSDVCQSGIEQKANGIQAAGGFT